ncbi:putative UDP-glucose epimerase YtcB [Streptomyces longisporoflavus]|uniref:NAD-dependent epimerase/dehydratase family protein n=1 Tax=Streptomyces longisporoflavus TaxID=28044 RepID=UPI0019922C91|nr:NAD-dependent epimerase/dehydratase family protein [Streptomyces longisporoflavus]GGV68143.1 putative UDP-glucose epimerase YtcB [Streptomyces longisporoflavus]
MRALVTGAAGFIGSHLCEHLLAAGDVVVGVDSLTDHYDPAVKRRNLQTALNNPRFTFRHTDLLSTDPAGLLAGADVVYHLAGQPGVRPSWGDHFALYSNRNVLATQRLLEAAHAHPPAKFVYASSSSVYGDALGRPTPETAHPRPVSPYGVTKLAGEHLCELYRTVHGLPTVALRLFTVYGPRQRPDMALARLLSAASGGQAFRLYGDGRQTRDFTYVSDVVAAMRAAARSPFTGVANIGGGSPVSMNMAVGAFERLVGPVLLSRHPAAPGDARHTGADIGRARAAFGFRPRVEFMDGLAAMARAADPAFAPAPGRTAVPVGAPPVYPPDRRSRARTGDDR